MPRGGPLHIGQFVCFGDKPMFTAECSVGVSQNFASPSGCATCTWMRVSSRDWTPATADDEILRRLLALNLARAGHEHGPTR